MIDAPTEMPPGLGYVKFARLEEMARVVFMGTPDFAVLILEALIAVYDVVAVVTQPDRRGGRGQRQVLSPPVKEAALKHSVPVMQPLTLRHRNTVEKLRALAPDVIVVAAFGQILRKAVLAIPPHGCLNVHASLLPKYRGASPVAAAILAGDEYTGVTIMLMDEGLDTGPILAQARLRIGPEDTTGTLTEQLAELGAKLLIETLPRWLAGEIVPQPQDDTKATYCRPLQRSDGRIDWNQPAMHLARAIRAYNPWPQAHTSYDGKEIKIIRAKALPNWRGTGHFGQVLDTPDGILVVTGEGALLLEEVQLAGKRAMNCQAFARGQKNFVGSILGK